MSASSNFCGLWLYGNVGNPTIPNSMDVRGSLPTLKWSLLETGAGTYNWNYFDNQVNYAISRNIYFNIEIWVAGPTNTPPTPSWLYSAPYNVPQVVMQTSGDIYPDFRNATYQTRWQMMRNAVVAHVAAYSDAVKEKILMWQICEGSTGDAVPYHGVPVNPIYNFTDDEWSALKRPVWVELYNQLASSLPLTALLINQGNAGENFQWANDNLPNCWMKSGDFSHNYSFPGELDYSNRLLTLRGTGRKLRGEAANPNWLTTDWNLSNPKNTFAIMCSALYANMTIFNMPPALYTANGGASAAYTFYNKYANEEVPTNKAFCALRDEIDLDDVIRFPEGTYGNVIDPSRLTAYTNDYNALVAENLPAAQFSTELTKLKIPYLNPARITAIRALFPSAAYLPIDRSRDGDAYSNDYNFDSIPDNYNLFITQYSPNTTSKGVWRTGESTSMYGRYGRSTDYINGKIEMFFILDPLLTPTTSVSIFTISYLDAGTGIWSLNVSTLKGKHEIKVVQNTNTNLVKTIDVTIEGIILGGELEHGSDFTIKYLNGNDTTFYVVEILL